MNPSLDDKPAENPRAVAGGNNPPEPTAAEAFKQHVDDLFSSASDFLDGEPIATEGQAEAVSKLLDDARTASHDANEIRSAERRPHDDASRAVQALWKPIITRADLAADACKKALAPWLKKLEDEQKQVAETARAEARRQEDEARALHATVQPDNLAERERAELALAEAGRADRAAAKAERAKPQVAGGRRATGLRSVFSATIVDRRLALSHYLAKNPDDFVALIQSLADHEARHGPRTAPGIEFAEERVAV